MNVIGAGGDGIVFVDLNEPNVVNKAIYRNNEACTKAEIEFNKQSRVYNCVQCLKGCDDPLVQLINKYVRVARPIVYTDEQVLIEDVRYGCLFKMERLNGLPLDAYNAFNPRLLEQIDPAYREEVGPIQAHLSFNSDIVGMFGVKYSKAEISRANPPRGYFSNAQTGFFDFLRNRYQYRLPLSNEQLEQIIGFIYGWIYFSCDVIPVDIEFTLGLNPVTHQYELNVLDFGMTLDKRSLNQNLKSFETRRFFTIYGDPCLSEKEIEQRLIEATSLDLYTSLEEEDSCSREAFLITKNLQPCSQCKNLTFYVDLRHNVFLCSNH